MNKVREKTEILQKVGVVIKIKFKDSCVDIINKAVLPESLVEFGDLVLNQELSNDGIIFRVSTKQNADERIRSIARTVDDFLVAVKLTLNILKLANNVNGTHNN